MKFKFICAWYDLWIGAFWDKAKRHLYVLPVPCVGVRIHFPPLHDRCPECGYMTTLQEGHGQTTRYECIECNWCGHWMTRTAIQPSNSTVP